MVAIHIQPSMALEEMNVLPKAFQTFKRHWGMDVGFVILYICKNIYSEVLPG